MESKKKILVLTSTYPRSENDTTPGFVRELCIRLVSQFKVCVLSPHSSSVARNDTDHGVEIRRYVYGPESWEKLAYDGGIVNRIKEKPLRVLLIPSFLLAQLAVGARLCRNGKIDAIHAHWLVPQGLVGVVLARLYRIPLLVTSHGSDLYGLQGAFWERIRKWVLFRCTHVATVSGAMRSTVLSLGMAPDKVSVAPMGVDLQTTFSIDSSKVRGKRLLFVGRLVEKKGVFCLIKAMAGLVKLYPDLGLDVVGGGPERECLEETARSEGLENNIRFHGVRTTDELPEFYRSASMLVMPTQEEGLGLVAVEAMGCGCPVVASDVPGMRDVVEHGATGLLCRPCEPDDIARQIKRLLKDEVYKQTLARNARAYVLSKFDWEIASDRYRVLLGRIAKE